jgi:hypothetical protein
MERIMYFLKLSPLSKCTYNEKPPYMSHSLLVCRLAMRERRRTNKGFALLA